MDDFWQWVISQPVTDDPSGDFIEDTKALIMRGGDRSRQSSAVAMRRVRHTGDCSNTGRRNRD